MRTCTTIFALALLALGAGVLASLRLAGGSADRAGVASLDEARYRSQNFDVETYARLQEQARGTAGLARRGKQRIFASGVLIARDLVLTCRHCTHVHSASDKRHAPDTLDVRLYDGLGETSAFPVVDYAHTSTTHDLCVLRIGTNEHGTLPATDRIQTLSIRRVELGDPLYVLHCPGGERLQVADGAQALFPYQATAAELARIESRLHAEGDQQGNAVRALRRSYRPGPDDRLLNFSTRWANQPTLGADCATHDGSSGAPVYAKRTGDLVGMLFAGGDPSRRGRKTSWENHEAILPAPVIVRELREAGLLAD